MSILRRQETSDGRGNVFVAEFTTGQGVFLLCLAIVILGAAFVTGRLVAEVDRPIAIAANAPAQAPVSDGVQTQHVTESPAQPTAEDASVKTGPTETYTISAINAETAAPAGQIQPSPAVQTSAPPSVPAGSPAAGNSAPSASPISSAAQVAQNSPQVQVEEAAAAVAAKPAQVIPVPPVSPPPAPPKTNPLAANTKPRLTDLPPLPSQAKGAETTPLPVEKPAVPAEQPVHVAEAPSAPAPQLVPADPPVTESAASGVETPLAAAAAPAPSSPPPDTKAKSGTFAVQLGSFTGAQRHAKAESLQKSVSKNYGLNAEIIDSDREDISRVVIAGYADKNSAAAACAELRKKSGLANAFVRAI